MSDRSVLHRRALFTGALAGLGLVGGSRAISPGATTFTNTVSDAPKAAPTEPHRPGGKREAARRLRQKAKAESKREKP